MTRRDADPRRVYDCPFPSHEEFGVHLHETYPGSGRWRLFVYVRRDAEVRDGG